MNRLLLIGTTLVLGALAASGGRLLEGQPAAENKPTLPREPSSFRDVVKKVLPAVVSLEARGRAGRSSRRPGDMQLSPDGDSARLGFGSGFLISARGVVVTNNHVVEGADEVRVQLASGKKFVSRTIRTDPKTDLAIVQLEAREALPFLEFGDSEQMEIGDRVLAVGAPFGLAGTVTAGIISGKGRSLQMNMYEDFLQTDAAINPGNSGGPLVNLQGKVIGITSAIKSRSGGFQGIGLAIAGNLGKAITAGLLKEGVVHRGYLGVGIRDVTEELAKELKIDVSEGVQVTRLYHGAPGEKAGLEKGDVIVRLGGKAIKDKRNLQTVVAGLPIGKPVDVEVIRGGKPRTLRVTIEEQPPTFGSTPKDVRVPEIGKGALAVEKIGVVVADLTEDLADALGYSDGIKGVLVTRIDRNGLAALAGIRPGWVILAIDKKKVATAKEAVAAIRDGSLRDGIVLEVRGKRGGKRTVTLREDE